MTASRNGHRVRKSAFATTDRSRCRREWSYLEQIAGQPKTRSQIRPTRPPSSGRSSCVPTTSRRPYTVVSRPRRTLRLREAWRDSRFLVPAGAKRLLELAGISSTALSYRARRAKNGNVVPVSICPTGSLAPVGIPASWTNDKTIGLNLSIPIYDQGVTNFTVAVAASQLDQEIATLNSTKLTVESDVRSALATLISARSSLVQARWRARSAAQVSLAERDAGAV